MTAWVPPLLLLCELTLVTSCAVFKTVVIFHQPTFPFTHLPMATSPHRPLARKGPFQIMAITFPIHDCTHATKLQVRPRSFLHPADKHHLIMIRGQILNWRLFAVKYLLQIRPALPWLLDIGHGRCTTGENMATSVTVPDAMQCQSENDLIASIYGSITDHPIPTPQLTVLL